jgi:hypothetical protein
MRLRLGFGGRAQIIATVTENLMDVNGEEESSLLLTVKGQIIMRCKHRAA